ncbi:MAG: PIN domain-containing protein [Rubrivivax sp.]|jgi:predicted nucleic acid-binding protein|nr:PIN domain-containing protein [Rubrivivax sp.]
MEAHDTTGTPWAVLDTNVVLAIWLWKDPRLDELGRLLSTGGIRWLSDTPTWDECLHELRPDRCASLGLAVEAMSEQLKQLPRVHWAPAAGAGAVTPPTAALRCSDPDDQKFIDLALSGRAQWLLTRDKAVLRLRGRALAVGLRIADPTGLSAVSLLAARPAPPR